MRKGVFDLTMNELMMLVIAVALLVLVIGFGIAYGIFDADKLMQLTGLADKTGG